MELLTANIIIGTSLVGTLLAVTLAEKGKICKFLGRVGLTFSFTFASWAVLVILGLVEYVPK